MKTIKKGKEIKRVKDKQAEFMIKKGWKYCPKSEYKDIGKEEEETGKEK